MIGWLVDSSAKSRPNSAEFIFGQEIFCEYFILLQQQGQHLDTLGDEFSSENIPVTKNFYINKAILCIIIFLSDALGLEYQYFRLNRIRFTIFVAKGIELSYITLFKFHFDLLFQVILFIFLLFQLLILKIKIFPKYIFFIWNKLLTFI